MEPQDDKATDDVTIPKGLSLPEISEYNAAMDAVAAGPLGRRAPGSPLLDESSAIVAEQVSLAGRLMAEQIRRDFEPEMAEAILNNTLATGTEIHAEAAIGGSRFKGVNAYWHRDVAPDPVLLGTGENLPAGVMDAEGNVTTPGSVPAEPMYGRGAEGVRSVGPNPSYDAREYSKGTMRAELLDALSLSRLRDLAARKRHGHLSDLEKLALLALAGGDAAQESAGGLIDAAQEEWGNGAYRVPVRVVGDTSRPDTNFVAVLTTAEDLSEAESLRVANRLQDALARGLTESRQGHVTAVVIPCGAKLEIHEVAGRVPLEVGPRRAPFTLDEMLQRGYEAGDFQPVPEWLVAGGRAVTEDGAERTVLRVIPGFRAYAVVTALNNTTFTLPIAELSQPPVPA